MIKNKRRQALYTSTSKICKTSLGLYVLGAILSTPAMADIVPVYTNMAQFNAASATLGTSHVYNLNYIGDAKSIQVVDSNEDPIHQVVGAINQLNTNINSLYTEAETVFAEKQTWVDNTLGITSANPDAVKSEYASTNYLKDATTFTGADIALDAQIKANADAIALKANASDVYTKTEAETIFYEKQAWVDNTLGITSANPDAVKSEYADTNYLKDATTFTGADIALDAQIKANADKNDTQDTGLSAIMSVIGGSYNADEGTITVDPEMSVSVPDGTTPPTTIVGGINQLNQNFTNGSVDANFANTTVDSLTIDGTEYGINSSGVATFASAVAASFKVDENNMLNGDGLTASAANVSGNANVGGNVVADGDISTSGTLNSQGLNAGSGTIQTTGDVLAKTVKIGTDTSYVQLSVNGAVLQTNEAGINTGGGAINTAGGGLNTNGGDINAVSGNITTTGIITGGTVTSTGDVNAGGNITTINGTVQGKNLAATEQLNVNGNKFVVNSDGDIAVQTDNFTVEGDTGNTTIAGTLDVDGATTLGDTLTVASATVLNDTLDVAGDTYLYSDLEVDGDTYLYSDLEVDGDTYLYSDLNVLGETYLSDTLTVGSATVLNDTLTVAGATTLSDTLDVAGATTLNDTLDVAGLSRFFDDGEGNYTLEVAEDSVTANKVINATQGVVVNASNTLTEEGLTTSSVHSYGEMVAGGQIMVVQNPGAEDEVTMFRAGTDGNVYASGTLDVVGATHLSNTLGVDGATTLGDTLTVTSATTLNDTLDVAGATTLGDTLTVTSATTLNDTLTVASATTLNDTLDVAGATHLSSTLGVDGAATMSSTLDVKGMSKFFEYEEGKYTLEVAEDSVTANKVLNAKEGVVFGSDTIAMTSVTQDAVSAQAADTNSNTLVSAAALQATRAAINNENKAVFGDLYAVDETSGTVSYNADALTGNGFTTAEDVTDALQKYAENVSDALGGQFADDGSWSANINNRKTVNYRYGSSSNVMEAINKVASNVGRRSDFEHIYNGVSASNSVNANIDALNETIGDLEDLNLDLHNLDNGGEEEPANIVAALNNLDATLGKIHNLNSGTAMAGPHSMDGDNGSNLAVGNDVTVSDHLVSLDKAIGNRNIESANEAINNATQGEDGSVAAGLEAAGNVIGDGDFGATNYVPAVDNLSDAVRGLDTNLRRVENNLNDLRHDFKTGMASMAAMTALVPNSRSAGNTSLSLGTGAYDGHTAMAVGGFHYLTDNLLLNAGVAWGNSSDATYRLGVTWSW